MLPTKKRKKKEGKTVFPNDDDDNMMITNPLSILSENCQTLNVFCISPGHQGSKSCVELERAELEHLACENRSTMNYSHAGSTNYSLLSKKLIQNFDVFHCLGRKQEVYSNLFTGSLEFHEDLLGISGVVDAISKGRPRLIILQASNSSYQARRIVDACPNAIVLAWTTLTNRQACLLFTQQLYRALIHTMGTRKRLLAMDVAAAFKDACNHMGTLFYALDPLHNILLPFDSQQLFLKQGGVPILLAGTGVCEFNLIAPQRPYMLPQPQPMKILRNESDVSSNASSGVGTRSLVVDSASDPLNSVSSASKSSNSDSLSVGNQSADHNSTDSFLPPESFAATSPSQFPCRNGRLLLQYFESIKPPMSSINPDYFPCRRWYNSIRGASGINAQTDASSPYTQLIINMRVPDVADSFFISRELESCMEKIFSEPTFFTSPSLYMSPRLASNQHVFSDWVQAPHSHPSSLSFRGGEDAIDGSVSGVNEAPACATPRLGLKNELLVVPKGANIGPVVRDIEKLKGLEPEQRLCPLCSTVNHICMPKCERESCPHEWSSYAGQSLELDELIKCEREIAL